MLTSEVKPSVATQSPSQPRLAFLDVTKGILVVLMVVYHSLNYSNQYYLGFRYLSFLPPSFIFITGFLISSVYLTRPNLNTRQLFGRLAIRGLKLAVLFTLLNIAVQLVRGAYENGTPIGLLAFLRAWEAVFVTGSSRFAVFEVLLPIAYLLLLAPLFIGADALHRAVLPILTLSLMGLCLWMERQGGSGNLNLISAGVLGMLAGRILPNPAVLGRFLVIAILAYLAYVPLGSSMGFHYLVQLLGATVALAATCAISVRIGGSGWPQRRLIRLGQYSLLSYIAQIFILQALSFFIYRPAPWSPPFFLLMLIAFVLTVLVIELTEQIRRRSPLMASVYRAVFP
jgi:peptidoglycan/LPS O-acetylase OafA/YrhL